jgi:hypothetical protein
MLPCSHDPREASSSRIEKSEAPESGQDLGGSFGGSRSTGLGADRGTPKCPPGRQSLGTERTSVIRRTPDGSWVPTLAKRTNTQGELTRVGQRRER